MAGAGHRVPRRGLPRAGQHRRLPAAGAARSIRRRRSARSSTRASPRRARCSSRFDEINAKFGEDLSPEEMDKVLEEQGKVQDRIDALNAWDLDSQLEFAMDALRCPPPDTPRHAALRRRAPPRRAVPPAAAAARPAAARRADQPPRRRVGGLAREAPQGLPGHGRRGHARSLLPRQRRRLDPRARSRQRHSVGGQLLVVARAEAAAAGARGEVREPAPAHAAARAGLDPHVAAGPPGQGQGAPQRLRAAAQRGRSSRRSTRSRSTSRRGRASATSWSRPRTCARASATRC